MVLPTGFTAALALLLAIPPRGADELASFEKRATVHVLENGWTFVIVERPGPPVLAWSTVVDAGAARDVAGKTGLAHMFEHMLMKGPTTVGSRDPDAEARAIGDEEEAGRALAQARRREPRPDPARLAALEARFRETQAAAARLTVPNEFVNRLRRLGADWRRLGAWTNFDRALFETSIPSDQVEAFARLESERFRSPSFREFHQERSVVREERRLEIEGQWRNRVLELVQGAVFRDHPYQHPQIGAADDIESLTRADAEAFFRSCYAPGNAVTAVVGDVRARELVPVLEREFGRIPARPRPAPLDSAERFVPAERRLALEGPWPLYFEGYVRPGVAHPDGAALAAIVDVLAGGLASRLHRALVVERKVAAWAQLSPTFPGRRASNLLLVMAAPLGRATMEQMERATREVMERLVNEDVSEEELTGFRNRARVQFLRGLDDDQDTATALAEHHFWLGDWRELFRAREREQRVSAADVRRVARELFQESRRVVIRVGPGQGRR